MNRRQFLKVAACGTAALMPSWLQALDTMPRKRNVLFIVVDDLRPELGCFGHRAIQSPNIDRLAARGTLFRKAYCQQAVCAPSRSSVLSGCRPDTTKIYDLKTPLRQAMPTVLTLPQFFHDRGYRTASIGKVYHHGQDDRDSWDAELHPASLKYALPENQAIVQRRTAEADAAGLKGMARFNATLGPATECTDVADDVYLDGQIAREAVNLLRKYAQEKISFFLATGFSRPHLPFVAPKRSWDLYNPADIAIPSRDKPTGAPDIAFAGWGELRAYSDIDPKARALDDAQTRRLIHGYYASVSYVDAQIGKVLDELDRLGLADNTAVVLWGDHGWKLGEYGDWCKHTNFELDTHAPLIVAAPGRPAGQRSDALVEFVDIYPTLVEECGEKAPAHCEGLSLSPLLRDPKRPWKTAAFSQYPRTSAQGDALMGRTVTDGRWRYTEWRKNKDDEVVARELYDHAAGAVARRNLADDAAFAADGKRLQQLLRIGWRGALP